MTSCPVCKDNILTEKDALPYPAGLSNTRKIVPNAIRLCGRCGVGVAFPPVSEEEMSRLYTGGEYWGTKNLNTSLKNFAVPFGLARSRWKLIEEYLISLSRTRGIRILDIGAGQGCLGLVASSSCQISVSQYIAVEPDSHMVQNLQEIWNKWRPITKLTVISSIDGLTDSYDVVVLSHVLEHLVNPLLFLRSAVALLTSKGLLYADVPNQDFLFKKDVFPHMLFFSPKSLKFLLEQEPLEMISMKVCGRKMRSSPLGVQPPATLRTIQKAIGLLYKFLPGKLLVQYYSWYFGMNHLNEDGTWIRALCRKKV